MTSTVYVCEIQVIVKEKPSPGDTHHKCITCDIIFYKIKCDIVIFISSVNYDYTFLHSYVIQSFLIKKRIAF